MSWGAELYGGSARGGGLLKGLKDLACVPPFPQMLLPQTLLPLKSAGLCPQTSLLKEPSLAPAAETGLPRGLDVPGNHAIRRGGVCAPETNEQHVATLTET